MMDELREATGFRAGRELLHVGDMVSVDSGYDGFMQVVKQKDGYWLVDCSKRVTGQGISDRDFKLECNLPYRYQVVDPIAPYAEPQIKIYCSQCDETVTGEIDFETGEIIWNESCASHMMVENEIASTCRLCAADSGRIERMQQQKASLKAYLEAKRQEFGLDRVRVLDLWPYFGSISEIDAWFAVNAEKVKMLSEVLTSGYIDYLKNMEDK